MTKKAFAKAFLTASFNNIAFFLAFSQKEKV
jgi:hypothetical protein